MGGNGEQYHTMSSHDNDAICEKCKEPLTLGPIQYKNHMSGKKKYIHKTCPISPICGKCKEPLTLGPIQFKRYLNGTIYKHSKCS